MFRFACRPVREKGRTTLTFQESPEYAVTMNRIASLIPPDKPYDISWSGAAGRSSPVKPTRASSRTFCVWPESLRAAFAPCRRRASCQSPGGLALPAVDAETEQGCPVGRPYFEHLAMAMMVAVVLQTDPRLPDAGNPEAQQRRIRHAVALMEANFASKLTLDEVVRAAGLSRFRFSRLFRQVVGLAPHQYLLRCRLRHAQKLLSAPAEGRSIADVAAEAGFADQAHLDRHFLRAYGVSPRQFRREHE